MSGMIWCACHGYGHGDEHDRDPDYMAEQMREVEGYEQPAMREKLPTTWKTRDGQVIEIKKMTDMHLANTIRLFRRHAEAMRVEMACGGPPGPQGEAAQDAFEAEITWIATASDDEFLRRCSQQYCALSNEARRRKLKIAEVQ